jgi:hypothetical protein
MRIVIAAIHGILTGQTSPSWPDELDAWLFERDPDFKVLKKEYVAGPFPRWNCWVKDPRLAQSLANELALFVEDHSGGTNGAAAPLPGVSFSDAERPSPCLGFVTRHGPPIWFVAHSNGAVIALLTAQRLIARGYQIGGLLLTGAACEADVQRNGVLEWCSSGALGTAIAYSSEDDEVVAGDPRVAGSVLRKLRDWAWGRLMWPYGCLGRTGWVLTTSPESTVLSPQSTTLTTSPESRVHGPQSTTHGPTSKVQRPQSTELGPESGGGRIFTRWFRGGHGCYFAGDKRTATFEQIYRDIVAFTPGYTAGEVRPHRPLTPALSPSDGAREDLFPAVGGPRIVGRVTRRASSFIHSLTN